MLRKAHSFLTLLTDTSGRWISAVAADNNIDGSDFSRVLRLAFVAPQITDRIMSGTQQPELTGQKISRLPELPRSWTEQHQLPGASRSPVCRRL